MVHVNLDIFVIFDTFAKSFCHSSNFLRAVTHRFKDKRVAIICQKYVEVSVEYLLISRKRCKGMGGFIYLERRGSCFSK